MVTFHFSMALSAAKCKQFYSGQVQYVVVTDDYGKTIQLPISRFRPFMTTNGLRGRFRLLLDNNHKFVALEKIG